MTDLGHDALNLLHGLRIELRIEIAQQLFVGLNLTSQIAEQPLFMLSV